jgi:hypothetical protein
MAISAAVRPLKLKGFQSLSQLIGGVFLVFFFAIIESLDLSSRVVWCSVRKYIPRMIDRLDKALR